MNLEDKIISIFKDNSGIKQYSLMLEKIKELNVSDKDLFQVLWHEAISVQQIGKHVFQSAYTLYKLNIECQISLKDALFQVLKEWDISIEEIPWYLTNQFSKNEIISFILELNLVDDVRAKTILYWIEKLK